MAGTRPSCSVSASKKVLVAGEVSASRYDEIRSDSLEIPAIFLKMKILMEGPSESESQPNFRDNMVCKLNLVVTLAFLISPKKSPFVVLKIGLNFLCKVNGADSIHHRSPDHADTMTPTLETCRLKKREGIRMGIFPSTSLTMIQ